MTHLVCPDKKDIIRTVGHNAHTWPAQAKGPLKVVSCARDFSSKAIFYHVLSACAGEARFVFAAPSPSPARAKRTKWQIALNKGRRAGEANL